MSDREFENYLALLSGMLRLRRTQRESIAGELRDHLIEHVAHLEASGSTHEEAVRRALEEFGDAAALAANFSALVGMRRRRLIMRCTIGTTVVMTGLVVALLAFRPEVRNDPTIAQAQEKPKAENEQEPPSKESGGYIVTADERLPGKTAMSRNEQANAATGRKLDALIDVDVTDLPLGTALSYLSGKVGVQFYLDGKAVSEIGVTSDDPVTLQLNQVPAEMALDLLLRPLEISYTLRSGVVLVSTQAELDAQVETRVYYIAEHTANELMDLIPSVLATNSWDKVGGLGTIRVFRSSLVISQTPEVHQKISKLLTDLEPVLAKGPKKQPAEGGDSARYGAMDRGGYGYGGAAGYGGGRGGYGGYGGGGAGYGQPGYGGGGGYGRGGYGPTGGYGERRERTGEAAPSPSKPKTPPAATESVKPEEPQSSATAGEAAEASAGATGEPASTEARKADR